MSHANVRVEARRLPPNASKAERDKSLSQLLRIFKRACNEYGIMHELKERESFVRKTDIKRRKKQARIRASMEVAKNPTEMKGIDL